ncbi:MAG: ThuA domain-containing protein [Treponema sp.]|jgi:type 1 glutamine amidotransferase|nr:ThuA domain-containing protein [Treponema sp.]
MKRALIFWGGWDGHEPQLTSKRFAGLLTQEGFEVRLEDNLKCLEDLNALMELDLIVACWTGGKLEGEQNRNVAKAVGAGVGLAGCHGGMCDAFRQDTEWQFMTGGQWVSHPGGEVEYMVNISSSSNPITAGLSDFPVKSEQYYLHVDPSIEVLATTRFPLVSYYHISNKPVDMPQVWTKMWGNGRVFYTALGHHDDVFDKSPNAQIMMKRGMLWAAEGKAYVKEHGLTTARFENNAKMY